MSVKRLEGFTVIPLRFSKRSTAQHDLFVKQHSVRNQSEDKPADRTLFVLNVPPYVTEDSFKRVFSCVGPVKAVMFQGKPSSKNTENDAIIKGFKVAYIVYQKSASVQKALQLTGLEPLSTDEHPVLTGMQKWVMEYNQSIYDHVVLEQNVNKFVAHYEKEEAKQKRRNKNGDDSGWTVVGKGRNPGLSRKESVANKLLEKTAKGEKRKYLDDFYTFQKRESKMNRLVEMRRKYEEDKKKVKAMKESRKFRPF